MTADASQAISRASRPAWWVRVWRIYGNIGKHRVVALAAGVTFYGLLAIFPALAALVSLYGLFADPATIASHLQTLAGVLPAGALEVIADQINRVAAQQNSTLGVTFLTGLAVSMWSANAGMKSLFDALNLVVEEEERRGFFRLNAISLAFTLGAIVFVLLALGGMMVVPLALRHLGVPDTPAILVKVLRWPLFFVVVALALAVLYHYGPSRREPTWRLITWGSVCAALTWLAVSILFSWYAENFASYNATYGSLGAVIGFMIWMWLSTIVILLGAEIDAELERPIGQDTARERPVP
ncbi:MAG TPA: YihY/virulence factor BrkB family protein [Xanthobacteraceae bacterium]|jgi:membrane protein|nr:YihY/virulence factor BrkB family protein [Xanthobacteraceae bacterium]